jgi:hypothetical protein
VRVSHDLELLRLRPMWTTYGFLVCTCIVVDVAPPCPVLPVVPVVYWLRLHEPLAPPLGLQVRA